MGTATAKMIAFATNINKKLGLKATVQEMEDFDFCKQFIDENLEVFKGQAKDYNLSEKQMAIIKKLDTDEAIELSLKTDFSLEDLLKAKKLISDYFESMQKN